MHLIKTNDNVFFFERPYAAKQFLNDSLSKTAEAYHDFGQGAILAGCGKFLAGRVFGVAALALASFTASLLAVCDLTIVACCVIPTNILRGIFNITGLSSFSRVQTFNQFSRNALDQTVRLNAVAIAITALFLSASLVNLVGALNPQNKLLRAMHNWAAPLGPLKTISAKFPGGDPVTGTPSALTFCEGVEEYCRALSPGYNLKVIETASIFYQEKRSFNIHLFRYNSIPKT